SGTHAGRAVGAHASEATAHVHTSDRGGTDAIPDGVRVHAARTQAESRTRCFGARLRVGLEAAPQAGAVSRELQATLSLPERGLGAAGRIVAISISISISTVPSLIPSCLIPSCL